MAGRKLSFSRSALMIGGAVLLVAACGGGNANSGAQQTAVSHPTLVIDAPNSPATLDPGGQYNTESYVVYRNIFDVLLRRDPVSLKIVPGVADSWKQSSPTVWEFTIHKGIKFQDGSDLTASDVAFSLNRILRQELQQPSTRKLQHRQAGDSQWRCGQHRDLQALADPALLPDHALDRAGEIREVEGRQGFQTWSRSAAGHTS